jgi:hypothetical protein
MSAQGNGRPAWMEKTAGAAGLLWLVVAGAGCSSDGSIGVGAGQDPDPVVLDFPIAYTKGPLLDEGMQPQVDTDFRRLERFVVGTDLYLRDRASPSAADRNITIGETEGRGDVAGVEISVAGTKLLFAMRGPFDPNLDDDEQSSWNIWEYDIPSDTLRRLIASNLTAEAGQDIAPHYLPDGRIVFLSTRQRQAKAILLDEGKPQFDALEENRNEAAYVLHVMNADGSELHQVSFNQSHDFDPTVLQNGKIMFSRWDNAGSVDGVHLYQMNPDGSGLELLYGAESHLTGTDGAPVEFIGAREMADGRVMAIARAAVHPELGGDIVMIDVQNFVEIEQPIASSAGLSGPAQISATPNQIRTDALPSRGGRFASAFPLWDGTDRVLASWAICRLIDAATTRIVSCDDERLADPNVESAAPLYGIWMLDPATATQLPIVLGEEGMLIGEVVAAQPRANPAVIPDLVPGIDLDADLVAENVGILNIRSVYDVDGSDIATPDIATLADPAATTPDQRPARFLRIEKAVPLPDEDVLDFDATAFGVSAEQGMREILGYAPIEPDGSVRVKVPAQVPLALSVLDGNGRRIGARHQNWLQIIPGQELVCSGCHAPDSGLSHGRSTSFTSAYAGAQTTGQPFPNTSPALFADFGETMAEARTRLSCATDCAALEPSIDPSYDDVWTDPDLAAPAASFAYRYVDLETPPPTALSCLAEWTARCRIVINYETHIHPLWSLPRQLLDPNDPNLVLEVRTCSQAGCHAPLDAMNNPAAPAAQLDLTDGLSDIVMDRFNAYQELLAQDNEVDNALQDVVIDGGSDANGDPILVNLTVTPSMSSQGANASQDFFSIFAPGGSHETRLSPAELRLISEWLDIGAQYYNNPFDIPVN